MRTMVPSTTSPCLRLGMSPDCCASNSSIVVGSGRSSAGSSVDDGLSVGGRRGGQLIFGHDLGLRPRPRRRRRARPSGSATGSRRRLGRRAHWLGHGLGDGLRLGRRARRRRRARPRLGLGHGLGHGLGDGLRLDGIRGHGGRLRLDGGSRVTDRRLDLGCGLDRCDVRGCGLGGGGRCLGLDPGVLRAGRDALSVGDLRLFCGQRSGLLGGWAPVLRG